MTKELSNACLLTRLSLTFPKDSYQSTTVLKNEVFRQLFSRLHDDCCRDNSRISFPQKDCFWQIGIIRENGELRKMFGLSIPSMMIKPMHWHWLRWWSLPIEHLLINFMYCASIFASKRLWELFLWFNASIANEGRQIFHLSSKKTILLPIKPQQIYLNQRIHEGKDFLP